MEIFRTLFFNLLVPWILIMASPVSSLDTFTEALLSFKSELVDPHNTLNDWFVPSSGTHPPHHIHACSWSAVTCKTNKNNTIVVGLNLADKNLGGELSGKQLTVFTDLTDLNLSQNWFSGKLPFQIFNLTSLKTLDISRNNFSGKFPGGISRLETLTVLDAFSNSFSGPLPAESSNLYHLKVLNLAGSYFSGPIPPQFGDFRKLEFLHLAGNVVSGKIPPELGNLQTLTHMEIGYNFYEGAIPWEIGNMSELQYLDIAGAGVSGSLPENLSNLTKLESLFLFRNQISGEVPWEFRRLKKLQSLDLSDNLIYGGVPESLGELRSLRLLSFMYNEMSGTVPESIAELPALETLLLWDNLFHGSLPKSLGENSKLSYVDVSTNNFTGAIPLNICSNGVLVKLILFSNGFSGSLSPSLSNCSSLVRLRIEDNAFSGEIPLNFSILSDITYVDLSRNLFVGGIPLDVSQASKLQYLNVSKNPGLGGTIPEKTWSLPFLQNFSASSCNISGNLPPFEYCKSVSVIELSMNTISGTIPETIVNCHVLEMVDLGYNKLSGHVPEVLTKLPTLRLLDLSHNDLNGSVPKKLSYSSSLRLLDLSFNPRLCGAPLRPCPDSMATVRKKLTWVILLCVVAVAFILLLALGVIYVQRGSKTRWKMIPFTGLPRFTASEVLTSIGSAESGSSVLPTGMTVSVKKVEWESKRIKVMSEFIIRMGNARHKNLVSLLGFCYNNHLAYLLYDHTPNSNLEEKNSVKMDWGAKFKTVIGIAKGLTFLHHDCYPAIPHGDLRPSSVVFDENMEPKLAEFGFKSLVQLSKGQLNSDQKEELSEDIHSFGEVLLQILSNGRVRNGQSTEKAREVVLMEIYEENEVGSSQDEIKMVFEVALLCIKSRPSERPSMKAALDLLSQTKPHRK